MVVNNGFSEDNNNCTLTKAIALSEAASVNNANNANKTISLNNEDTTKHSKSMANGNGYHVDLDLATKQPLIKVTNGGLNIGSKVILSKLNMSVEQGSIYALLGASGCGKTTILSCVVGIRTLTVGDIHFCGENLETIKREQGGLRRMIGYMPQELALYKEFTIKNALFYFGRIYGLPTSTILKQVDFLVDFLNLPKCDTAVRNMSGGEQRRTSFAVALLHSPKLLILDEPTVGVDPLLRKHIWEHLVKLTSQNTTVVITTHYMEEAKAANRIGIMRKGTLLAEGPPITLMATHTCNSMDELFLKLSTMDAEARRSICSSTATTDKKQPKTIVANRTSSSCKNAPFNPRTLFPFPGVTNRLHALTMKNFIYIWRQLSFIFILLLFPGIQLTLCCWALGGEPFGLPFGIINEELSSRNLSSCNVNANMNKASPTPLIMMNETTISGDDNNETNFSSLSTCADGSDGALLSCRFILALEKLPTLKLQTYNSVEEATVQVQKGLLWGYMEFPPNFTMLTFQKAADGLYADNATILNSRVRVQLDVSNHYIATSIQYVLFQTFQNVMKNTIRDCEPIFVPEVIDPSIWLDEAIYGRHKPSLTEYMSPGLILIIMFFTALSITGINYIVEKREGMLERTVVAGVSPTEIITAQLLTHFATIVLQICICFAVLIGIFKIEIHGPVGGVILLTVLQGCLGMFAGFLLSSVCDEEKVVMQWTAGITIPCLILAGIVWPLAAMPTILKYVAYIFVPQTFACESLRSMITRGWGITHPDVWPGFAVTMAWLTLLWISSLICARRGIYK